MHPLVLFRDTKLPYLKQSSQFFSEICMQFNSNVPGGNFSRNSSVEEIVLSLRCSRRRTATEINFFQKEK